VQLRRTGTAGAQAKPSVGRGRAGADKIARPEAAEVPILWRF